MVTTHPNPSSVFLVVASILFFLSALALHGVSADAASALPANATVPALFVFGDSLVDPGNNNDLKTIAKCNFEPYGRDFAGSKPTGRFSNGRVASDMLAEMLGVKELLPAYLDPALKIEDLLTGVSFATGGSGYDPKTVEIFKVLSLPDQLNLFNQSIARIKVEVGEEKASSIMSESAYIACVGSNDITKTFVSPVSSVNISAYTDLMINFTSDFIQELYGFGARRIGIVSLPPIGCLPALRTLRGGLKRDCINEATDASFLYNSKLSSLIDSLSTQLKGSKIAYLDIYNAFLPLMQNASHYGFEVTDKGCCGTGNLEVSFLCNKFNVFGTCKDDEIDKYVFWDSFHPTEKAYKLVLEQIKDDLNKLF